MTIKKFGVLGTGQMGAGIAQVAAQSGLDVIMADINLDIAKKGAAGIEKLLAKGVEKGKVKPEEKDAVMARLHPVASMAELKDCDFVVEAATEKLDLKVDLFKKLDETCRPGIILATNTSSISITLMAGATKRPDKVIGMHFMNPVPVMKLVEIIRGLQTDDETYRATKELSEKFGKTVVTSKDSPGFIVNKILTPLLNEACYSLMEGIASAEDIDNAIKLGLNHPMGPLTLADLIGLDTILAIAEVLYRDLGDPKYRPALSCASTSRPDGWAGRPGADFTSTRYLPGKICKIYLQIFRTGK